MVIRISSMDTQSGTHRAYNDMSVLLCMQLQSFNPNYLFVWGVFCHEKYCFNVHLRWYILIDFFIHSLCDVLWNYPSIHSIIILNNNLFICIQRWYNYLFYIFFISRKHNFSIPGELYCLWDRQLSGDCLRTNYLWIN